MKIFNQNIGFKPKKNAFDLSHEKKLSCNMGDLIPILCEEIIPGDTFKMNSEIMMRLAPMISPVMHRVNVYTHFFFVPNRLVWDNWQKFITGGEKGTDLPVAPYLNRLGSDAFFQKGQLADYMGYNVVSGISSAQRLNALPFRAYHTIYNEYYRDQNLENPLNVNKTDGEDSIVYSLQKRAWEKDYFTSSLPWTQKGGDVSIPLDTATAPVVMKSGSAPTLFKQTNNNSLLGATGSTSMQLGILEDSQSNDLKIDPNGGLEADLSGVNISTVEDLRRATRLQRWLERNARSGSRYIESIFTHFGVVTPDYRLQRPEFLGGGKTPVVISEVLQTSSSDTTTPQGNLAGHGMAVGNSHSWTKTFNEHGFVIGIMSVLPKTAYMQGIRKHFLKTDKFDYYWPEFAQLGEQPVYRKELYNNEAYNSFNVFGYQSRYCEYKYIPSSANGDFRDNLKFWHMAREFSAAPALNSTFVKSDPTSRIFASTDASHKLWVQIYHNIKAIRPIPYFNSPTL